MDKIGQKIVFCKHYKVVLKLRKVKYYKLKAIGHGSFFCTEKLFKKTELISETIRFHKIKYKYPP